VPTRKFVASYKRKSNVEKYDANSHNNQQNLNAEERISINRLVSLTK
jgi:hypothetical protein